MSLGEICGGIMERRRGLICSWCSYSETPSGHVHFLPCPGAQWWAQTQLCWVTSEAGVWQKAEQGKLRAFGKAVMESVLWE